MKLKKKPSLNNTQIFPTLERNSICAKMSNANHQKNYHSHEKKKKSFKWFFNNVTLQKSDNHNGLNFGTSS